MILVLTPEACVFASAPDRSLGTEGINLRHLISEAMAPPAGRDEEAFDKLSAALVDAFEDDRKTVSLATFERALSLMKALPNQVPFPEIVVESETEIGLDWDAATRLVLSVTVDESPRIGYSSLIGYDSNYGRLEFAEGAYEIPHTLRAILSQIYPRRTSNVGRFRGGVNRQ